MANELETSELVNRIADKIRLTDIESSFPHAANEIVFGARTENCAGDTMFNQLLWSSTTPKVFYFWNSHKYSFLTKTFNEASKSTHLEVLRTLSFNVDGR